MKNILCLLCLIASAALAQDKSIQIGTQVPLCYSIGGEYKFNERISTNLQFGLLTKPYTQAILETLKAMGTEDVLIYTIGDAFTKGVMIQPSARYHIKRSYLGLSYSLYNLNAQDVPEDLIEEYYNVNVPDNRRRGNIELEINSLIHNLGLFYGYEIPLKNSFSIKLELSLQKILYSSTSVSSEEKGTLDRVSAAIDKGLSEYYWNYGFLPSLNVFLVYTLNSKN